ncbi:MAG: nitroreductase family protein [Bacteroidales bacterium]|nr:nitroreductase family protein [Bacteroidales bacterium]
MLTDILKKSRSYRSFDESVKINESLLLEWIDGTRYAPSSINRQPLKYRLVFMQEELDKIQPLTHWARALPKLEIPPKGHYPVAFIIILCDTDIAGNTDIFIRDVGICAQTILLQAVEAGYGGCMIGNFNPKAISDALCLHENLQPKLILALGKPDEEITLVDADTCESTNYYRDDNGHHFVPKRKLEDIIVK